MQVVLTTEYKDRIKARSVPGAVYDSDTKAWIVNDPTPRSAAVALRMFPSLLADYPILGELRTSLGQEIRPFDSAAAFDRRIVAPTVAAALAKQGHSFYDFQAIDLGYLTAVLRQHGAGYLGWERGLGKTLGACAIADSLGVERLLVVAPNTAKLAVWKPDLEVYLPDHEVVVLRNTKSKRQQDLGWCSQLKAHGRKFALVVHYEALSIELTALNRLGEWDLVVSDETHHIKNQNAKQTRSLKKIKTKYKLALSGTILSNHAEELFSQLQWLFPKTYSSKWRDWNNRFLDFVEGGFAGRKVCVGIKTEQLENMRRELGVFMTYRRKEDELDLPGKIEETRYVELAPAQRTAYDQLRDEYATQLADGTVVTAADGLVLLTRLRQVATGLDTLGANVTDSAKLDLAVELIEDNPDEAYVVFSWFKSTGRALAARLAARGIDSYIVDGDTKSEDRAARIQAFQGGSEARVFIGTISTLGESVTLHRASNAIFLDRSWNPGDNAQAVDRIYRIGQGKAVVITYIVASDTVDEFKVAPALADKEALRRMILGGN